MTDNKNILIIGKNSYISNAIQETKELNKHNIFFTTTSKEALSKNSYHLDLSDPESFDISKFENIEFAIFLASVSSPDLCEKNYKESYKINVIGTSFVIKKLIEMDKKVIFFSSDTVYGECKNEVNELSDPNPIGSYGKMKLEVEEKFLTNKNFKSLRLSYVFSKNDKFSKYLLECSKDKKICEIYHPLYRKVIYINDLLELIQKLVTNWEDISYRIINVVGNKLLSRVDMAEYYKELIDRNLKYKTVTPDDSFFKARPKIINANSLYLDKILNRKPTEIKNAMIQEFKK